VDFAWRLERPTSLMPSQLPCQDQALWQLPIEFTGAYLEIGWAVSAPISLRVLAGTTEIETTTEVICDLDVTSWTSRSRSRLSGTTCPLPPHPTRPRPCLSRHRTWSGDYGRNRWSASDQSQQEPLGGYRVTVAISRVRARQRSPAQRT